MTKKRFTQHD